MTDTPKPRRKGATSTATAHARAVAAAAGYTTTAAQVGPPQPWRPLFRGADSIVAEGKHWPSEHSARWWHRQHAAEAVRAGALIRLRGQWMADPDKLARIVAKIGRREAERALSTVGQ